MDPDSQIFYQQLLDFGPGVSYDEGKEKYMIEKRKRDAFEERRMDNVAMLDKTLNFLKNFIETERKNNNNDLSNYLA
tara:strand:+ start:402 stop:632 length:231 start_codon:yes stop_codon:yes gene_type:complete